MIQNRITKFLSEPCISLSKDSLISNVKEKAITNKYLSYLYTNYDLTNLSCNDALDIMEDLCKKLLKTDEDKYAQKGINGLVRKLFGILIRVWNRCLSIMLSIGFQVTLFIFNLYTSQSIFLSLVASSIYFLICYIILDYSADLDFSSKWYIPYNILKKHLSRSSFVEYIKNLFTYTKKTLNSLIDWFTFKLDDDEKRTVKVRRRWALLFSLVLFLSLIILH